MTARVVVPLSSGNIGTFLTLHRTCGDWCYCAAWSVSTWDDWGKRDRAENLAVRQALIDASEFDGYLALDGEDATGWCQAGPAARWPKFCTQFGLPGDDRSHAVACLLVRPDRHRRGVARALVEVAIAGARAAGASRILAVPRVSGGADAGDLWNGPAALYAAFGFAPGPAVGPRRIMTLPLR